MPELPEVETTRRGIAPYLEGQRLRGARVRDGRLRWPVPNDLAERVTGRRVRAVERRGKYLILRLDQGALLLHLGMSGSLRLVDATQPPQRHDHVDLLLPGGRCLRLHDPRRFGALLWLDHEPLQHPLLAHLGPEPLGEGFDGDYLWRRARGRRQAIKTLLMDSRVVVGVGNIYANEALFQAGIRPGSAAGRVSRARCAALVVAIRRVLQAAITQGGTTLRDFVDSDGQQGYFQLRLDVYGRAGEPCRNCQRPIKRKVLGQRSTYYCPGCQK